MPYKTQSSLTLNQFLCQSSSIYYDFFKESKASYKLYLSFRQIGKQKVKSDNRKLPPTFCELQMRLLVEATTNS